MKGMTSIVRNTARLVSAFVMLFGLYVTLTGHLSPGGGFTGGVLLMAGGVLLVLSFGLDRISGLTAKGRCHLFDGVGALGFALVALVGLGAGGFFVNWLPLGQQHEFFSGGTILVSNVAIAMKVSAGLAGIFLALVLTGLRAMPKE